MNRFFVNRENIIEEKNYIRIDNQEDRKHIVKVLRLNIGDCVEISDGCGHVYIAEIQSISESVIDLKLLEKRKSETEPNVEIILFQSIPKSDKMEMIIQKTVELGIAHIVPVISQRTVVRLDGKNEQKKLERWRKIASEAAKQCKRGMIPEIHPPIFFEQMLKQISQYDFVVIPYEKEKELGLKDLLKNREPAWRKIGIVIGPEGGFTEEEISAAKSAGAVSVTLGPRILRTETAGFVVLSIFMYEIGDLGGI
ncbi:MAG TPA: 16S rRNA (uracil(1498)-N(3))-methyltransferase [Clostridiales bacterium]|nr:16S rRNA (uracil(1498)-N(3))-methyltransferase [Clostridiales bacterium]